MKKVLILLALCALVGANGADAQAMHYDLYYGLPGEAGSRTVDVGLVSRLRDSFTKSFDLCED